MIHKEGFLFLKYTILISLLIVFLSLIFFFNKIFLLLLYIFIIAINLFVIFFFRNPKINLSDEENENIIFSPSDGKILNIEEFYEHEFFHKKCLKISIFLSIFDIHINRYPVSGKIIYKKYHPGKFFFAWVKKSSLINEHTTIVIKTNKGKKILLRQIAGFIARRIILYAKKEKKVKVGKELGFIKFGSRIDVFLPLGSVILVKKGEKVIGGITKLSFLSKKT